MRRRPASLRAILGGIAALSAMVAALATISASPALASEARGEEVVDGTGSWDYIASPGEDNKVILTYDGTMWRLTDTVRTVDEAEGCTQPTVRCA